ncbi:hypothetical protein [Hymenobacter nivis]|uniref:Uncharacterized protein n=1 Tax=Hymenobacter nivis TaxID=1850093 RepID=A0A502GXB0_9BACT|nr:hypothetical protein [Hymenobacter nivis]TPG66092.1 hypothetical protein EAH73_12035 [Hymenobacter nivis]
MKVPTHFGCICRCSTARAQAEAHAARLATARALNRTARRVENIAGLGLVLLLALAGCTRAPRPSGQKADYHQEHPTGGPRTVRT